MSKYILIGIPGSGKSTLGRRSAEVLDLPFYDIDLMVAERLDFRSIRDQIRAAMDGSIVFEQRAIVLELAETDSAAIVSTGAEVALMPVCARYLRRMGTVIHVQRNKDIILADVAKEKHQLIWQEKSEGKEFVMRARAVELYAKELAQYDTVAHCALENDGTEEEGLEKLLKIIKPQ